MVAHRVHISPGAVGADAHLIAVRVRDQETDDHKVVLVPCASLDPLIRTVENSEAGAVLATLAGL